LDSYQKKNTVVIHREEKPDKIVGFQKGVCQSLDKGQVDGEYYCTQTLTLKCDGDTVGSITTEGVYVVSDTKHFSVNVLGSSSIFKRATGTFSLKAAADKSFWDIDLRLLKFNADKLYED